MKRVFLLDGTAIIYRAFYAFIKNPLYNSKGMNTSAIYGSINIFFTFLEKFDPEYIAISFDLKGPTFRNDLSEDYKAQRKPMPEELVPQIEPIREFFRLIGIKEYSLSGYEADDMLATLAETLKKEAEVVFVTGDKDFCQLLDENVWIYNPAKDEETSLENVVDKYGIPAEKFVQYLAIVGDSADNFPGVKGIGPKGAEKLLTEFDSLDDIYNNLDKIFSKSMRTKLENHKDEAYLSLDLARIRRNVRIDKPTIDDLYFEKANLHNISEFFEEYELNRLQSKLSKFLKNLPKKNRETTKQDEEKIKNIEETFQAQEIKFQSILVSSNEELDEMIHYLNKYNTIAFDTETTSVNPLQADLVGASFCADNKKAFYVSIMHKLGNNVDKGYFLDKIKSLFEGKLLIGHNLKYDIEIFSREGIYIKNNIFDTMIASYLLNPKLMRHSLDACSKEEFNYEMQPISELIGSGKKQITFDMTEQTKASFYASEDAYITYRLFQIYQNRLKDLDLLDLFNNIEIPLIYVLCDMELTGTYVDNDTLKEISNHLQKKLSQLLAQIYEISGEPFNLNSTQQLAYVLFEKLGIKPLKKTKSGYSTDNSVLEKLAEHHQIARLMMQYRQLAKLESTYTKALTALINPETGRIHSTFNQTITSTGRLSSTNPNLQNIPIRSEEGKQIRKAFCAQEDDFVILAADYSQIELRLMALFSKDENMVKAYQNEEDIHSQTASIIFDKDIKEVTSDDRRRAKVINFGLLYGMGAQKLAKELHIKTKEAKEFIEKYFEKFPTINDFIEKQKKIAKTRGYAQTIFGRKLFLPELNNPNSNRMVIAGAERVAVNMPIQGTAADLIKIAMINIHHKIKNNPEIKMMIQVHDELVFEVKKSFVEEAKEIIKNEMENALPEEYRKIVPLKAGIGIGKNWYEAH